MPKVIKPSNPFTNVCWVSVFNNIFCAATNFGCIDSFLLPNSETEKEMMGDGFLWCYCCRFVLNSKHFVISRASAVASSIFHGVIPGLFEVRRIVCVEN